MYKFTGECKKLGVTADLVKKSQELDVNAYLEFLQKMPATQREALFHVIGAYEICSSKAYPPSVNSKRPSLFLIGDLGATIRLSRLECSLCGGTQSKGARSFPCVKCNLVFMCETCRPKHDAASCKDNCDLAKDILPKIIENASFCATCGVENVPLKQCGHCKQIKYCSRACQVVDWQNFHRLECHHHSSSCSSSSCSSS